MYKIIEWDSKLDLTEFYSTAASRGFANNSNQKSMIDCFRNEKKFNAWILYKKDRAIASVVAHSFDDVMGKDSYRVLSRCCVLDGARENFGLITPKRAIAEHQNITDQFLLPVCIDWAGKENLYATSNASKIASQRLVHSIYFPTLAKIGIVEEIKDIHYRGTDQTVWKINADRFLENLQKYPRWI